MIAKLQRAPTKYPPKNSEEIDAPPATNENMMNAVLGGMTIPVGADAIFTAVANLRS